MLNGIFNLDSPIMRFLSRVADLMILNLLFLLCSIPLVTIGASWTALTYVTLKMKDEEEGYLWKSFLHSFRINFRQSTIIWLIMLVFGVIFGTELLMLRGAEGNVNAAMRVMVLIAIVLWLFEFVYVFALQARFYNTIRQTFMNALLMALANAPRSVAMVAIFLAILIIPMLNGATIVYVPLYWLILGFAVQALINARFLHPALKRLMPAEETAQATSDMEFRVDEETPLTVLGHAGDDAQAETESAETPAPAAPESDDVSAEVRPEGDEASENITDVTNSESPENAANSMKNMDSAPSDAPTDL